MSKPTRLEFRADINGLRAYAVMAVLFYHFNLTLFPAGFLGVDVFFVISGFLMAALIVPKLELGTFSLKDFYFARLRRIFPALATLCITLLVLGWYFLGPTDYYSLGRQSIGSVTFISNFIYRVEQGYFDAPSRAKWLLHTWSLATEAQFYLCFPLVLLLLKRFGQVSRVQLTRALGAIALLSFIISVWCSKYDQEFAFFLLPARVWELLAGSLLFINTRGLTVRARWPEWLGIALILAAAITLDTETPWPGYLATIPVLGTLLVLYTARQKSLLTGNPIANFLGKWSYSIYLWHWPVVVAMHYFGKEGQADWIIAGLTLSLSLGALSYYFIEQPTRRVAARYPHRSFVYAMLAAIAAIGVTELGIKQTHGFEQRFSETIQIADRETNNRAARQPCGYNPKKGTLTPCEYGEAGQTPGYVLWGDSHVGSIVSALHDTVKKPVLLYSHACHTIFNVEVRTKEERNRCRDFEEKTFAQVSALPKNVPVIIANRFAVNLYGPNEGLRRKWGFVYYDLTDADQTKSADEIYKAHVRDSFCRIAKTRRVYVMKPVPEIGLDVPRTLVRRLIIDPDTPDITMPIENYYSRNKLVLEALENAAASCHNITLLDPLPYLCDKTQCYASEHQRPRYIDDNHVSEFGNRALMPMFARAFSNDVRADWRARQKQAPIGPVKRLF